MIECSLPYELLKAIEVIEKAGYEAWCVGGAVRDILMGKTPDDYDIASNAPCESIMKLFHKIIPTGLKHGTVTVIMNGSQYEITRYRIDGEYTDSRRPDSVEFTSLFEEDLARRDFTVNAIGYHPKRGIFDPFGGANDIKKGIIKTVGEPDKRFSEDALRILRAIRFSAKLGFDIEKETLDSVIKNSKTLKAVSAERIREELMKTLVSDNPQRLEIILKSGGLEHLGLFGGELSLLKELSKDPLLRFAALCVLTGGSASEIAKNLRFSNAQTRISEEYFILLKEKELNLPFIKSNCKSIGIENALIPIKAWGILHSKNSENLEKELTKAIENNDPYLLEHLDISGKHIALLGFSGEAIGRVQKDLLQEVRKNPSLNERNTLKELAKKL